MNYVVLIPVYNEEETIQKVIKEVQDNSYNLLVVNDGSTDRTLDKIKELTDNYVTYKINMGKGYAIKQGAKQAIANGCEWVIIVDADGQTPIRDIINVWKLHYVCPEAKVLIGNRLYNPKGMQPLRLKVNKVMSWIISKLAGQRIYDSQCGLKIIHKDVFALELKSDGFDFETEMLVKAGRKGYRILSRPIDCIYFKDRKSKMHPIKDALKFIKLIIKLFISLLFKKIVEN